jgi:hypothetical protein
MQPGAQVDQSLPGGVIRAVSRYGASTLIEKTCASPIDRLDPAWLAVADPRIVNHGVESTDRVRLLGDAPGLVDARQVTDDHAARAGEGGHGVTGAPVVSCVQRDLVALLDQEPSGHQAEPVGRNQ